MVVNIVNILRYNPYENNLIGEVKNHNPLKGEKGNWKGEKGKQ